MHLAALWTYDERGTVARLQQRLKYGNRPHLGDALGRWLAESLPEASFDLVVPVPLHGQRLLARGYNQSARLARGAASARELPYHEGLLRRARPTRTQTKLGHGERWDNVRGAFVLPSASTEEGQIEGRHVLLVDDVMTTGATLAAAALPLVDAGAVVSVAALACTREYV
ncbi:MAG: phosphoribosyltransferase family protein [Bacteroidota bacterium]